MWNSFNHLFWYFRNLHQVKEQQCNPCRTLRASLQWFWIGEGLLQDLGKWNNEIYPTIHWMAEGEMRTCYGLKIDYLKMDACMILQLLWMFFPNCMIYGYEIVSLSSSPPLPQKLINISSEVINIHILSTQTKYFQTTYSKKVFWADCHH